MGQGTDDVPESGGSHKIYCIYTNLWSVNRYLWGNELLGQSVRSECMKVIDRWSRSLQSILRLWPVEIRSVNSLNYIWNCMTKCIQMRCHHTKSVSRWLRMMKSPLSLPKKLWLYVHSLFFSAIITTHFKVQSSMLESPKLIICTIKGCTTSATVSALILFLYWRFEHCRLPEPDEMLWVILLNTSRQSDIPKLEQNHIPHLWTFEVGGEGSEIKTPY